MASPSPEIRPNAEQSIEVDPSKVEETVEAIRSTSNASSEQPPYSIFTLNEKRLIVVILTSAALFSPISSTIYYPSLTTLAADLHVSNTLINLTITSFMIFQGLAPAFIGAFSDAEGRRPAYLICFTIYIIANIGLALQKNYAALFILRCVQSSGSSGTIALANAVVSDIAMPSERGTWMGWANCGALLGLAFGPIIGGLLSQYLGWKSIFWFLAIFAGVTLKPLLLFFPETCRAVVSNGSLRPAKWNRCLLDRRLSQRLAKPSTAPPSPPIPPHRLRFPNPLKTLALLFEQEASLLLVSSGFLFAGYYALMAAFPSQLAAKYGYTPLKIGLCFIPCGAGGLLSALTTGRLMDANFRRHAHRQSIAPAAARQQRRLAPGFPIEAARMEVALPFVGVGAATMLAFGWLLHARTGVAGVLVLVFFVGYATSGAFTVLSTLIVDLFPAKPATATAAANITRCWLGAAATAVVVPMIARVGAGWTFTFVAALWVCLVPPLWAVVRWGPGMRAEKERREREREGRARAEDVEVGGDELEVEKKMEADVVGGEDEKVVVG
ncbi:MFS general substrate transporter [Glonium stellatum]|uniref:MFS general substrate transporter n=1 Tax=Glonium stellatum TaxID=574774 RepID=A0A8E2EP08_9PEZI|nr:MFS general substrate transporter [Glonium stellatum]